MKSGSNPNPRDDDDFTSAAESLLGIDLSASGLSGAPIDLDDADLFGEPDVVEPEATETSSSPADETQDFRPAPSADRLTDDEDDFGSDFGAGIVGDEPPPPARSERRLSPPPQERPAPRADERPARRVEERPTPRAAERPPSSEEPPPAPAPTPRKDDSYWDALEGWDWSDETSGAGKSAPKEDAPPPRGRSGDRSRGRGGDRQSRRSSEPAPERAAERPPAPSSDRPRSRPQAKAIDDDFGGGLEEAPGRRGGDPSPDVSIFSLNPTESQSRYLEERDEEAQPAPDVSTFGLNPTESQVRKLGDRDEPPQRRGRGPAPRPAEIDTGDEFGSGLEEESASRREYRPEPQSSESGRESSEGEQRRGRRRGRGRGRGQGGQDRGRNEQSRPPVESRRDEPESSEDLSFDEPFDEPPRAEPAPVEPELQEPRFQDVPTWAEAISLLVKQRPRTSTSGSGERGRSESSESGERGGNGNGGRGRGRGRRGGGGGRRSD